MAVVASWALQRSIYQALANSSDLTALLGGVRIYDDAPKAASFPFISLGQSVIRDWSTGTEDGAEHSLTLHVWSRSGGKKQVQEIIEAIKAVLHDQPLLLADHHLVNLRHEVSEARLDPDGDTFHGIVRYRAVTEPAQAVAA
ncbi:MAG: DUF3168 domain-containing protein [Methyloceanibacter sp.]|nr:DUF3168 domain-containing protein [Methyloceanibacter sp.]